jgi:predicted 2-oxoglutarate/Fe(II)-dependent dioxygenase YbiX
MYAGHFDFAVPMLQVIEGLYTRDTARSLLTLLVYLDDDFDGGETDFPEEKQTIRPRAGDALWFQHALLHAGNAVTRGTKHVLRSDVLYVPA